MKLSNRKFTPFILYLSLITLQIGASETSITPINSSTPSPEEPQLNSDEQIVLEKLTLQPLQDLEKIDVILSTTHIKCANGTIRVCKLDTHLDAIAQVRSLIQEIKNTILVNPQQAHPLFICAVVTELTKNINTLIDTKFSNPLSFDIDAVYARLLSRSYAEPSIGTLAKILVNNTSGIKKLEQNAEQAGLTWYNKKYRPFRKAFIKPVINNIELTQALAASLGIFFYFYSYQKNKPLRGLVSGGSDKIGSCFTFLNSYIGLKSPQLLKQIYNNQFLSGASAYFFDLLIGEYPDYSMNGIVRNPEKLGLLGTGESWFYRSSFNQTIVVTLFAHKVSSIYQSKSPFIWGKIKNILTEWDNNLLGGIYKQQNKFMARAPTKTFNDVIGAVEAKNFGLYLADAVAHQSKYCAIGATPPMAIFLVGGPRSGKTNFAEALGGEINLRSGNDGLFYSPTHDEIHNLGFEVAISIAKGAGIQVLFIDEFHLFFPNPARQVEALKALNERYDPKNPLIVVCATNSPEKIPKDLYKRFDHVIQFEKTTVQNRQIFLERELYKNGITLSQQHKYDIACEARNNSYEDLIRLIEQAKILAVSRAEAVSEVHVREKFDETIRKIISYDEHAIPESTQKIIAANIAAETLITLFYEAITKEEITATTIKSYKTDIKEASELEKLEKTTSDTKEYRMYGKVCTLTRNDKITLLSHAEKEALCKILIAGNIGEALILGHSGYDYHADKSQRAFQLALSLVSQGLDTTNFTNTIKTEYLQKAHDLLGSFKKEVCEILEDNENVLHTVYNALLQEEILYRDRLQQIITPENAQKAQTLLPVKEIGFQEVAA